MQIVWINASDIWCLIWPMPCGKARSLTVPKYTSTIWSVRIHAGSEFQANPWTCRIHTLCFPDPRIIVFFISIPLPQADFMSSCFAHLIDVDFNSLLLSCCIVFSSLSRKNGAYTPNSANSSTWPRCMPNLCGVSVSTKSNNARSALARAYHLCPGSCGSQRKRWAR